MFWKEKKSLWKEKSILCCSKINSCRSIPGNILTFYISYFFTKLRHFSSSFLSWPPWAMLLIFAFQKCWTTLHQFSFIYDQLHFFILGQPRPLFYLFSSFQTHIITIFTTNKCEKLSCPSSIQCRDSNSWPLEHESPPINTRPRYN